MTTLSAVSRQVEFKVHSSKWSWVCTRAACWHSWTRHEWCLLARSLNSDLDFADNVSVMAELLKLLIYVLETIASEAPLLGFKVN